MAVRNTAPLRGVAFGSCQDRKLFPTHCAPNRLGNEMSLQGDPHRGPGCYDDNVIYTIVHDIQTKPESKKGYSFAARTAARFLPSAQTTTPSPQKYQQDNTWLKVCPPNKTPFNCTSLRFKTKSATADSNPGPGAYAHDTPRSRRVTWPMSFGSPDWARLPKLEKRALRMELLCDKEFQKQRTREAYLSLFYS